MTPSLWFVVPAHGRHALAAICLHQLRRTCDLLSVEGVRASVVVIADDENLDTATDLGFATIRRNNHWLSRKFNDGIQLALDPEHNPYPADYVVPFGSDDWADHRLFVDLPAPDTMVGFTRIAVVREDGRELATRHLNYTGGCGIRIYPAALMRPLHYRPADEDRARACDTSILTNLQRHHTGKMRIEYGWLHPYQIVDWKSPSEQMNSYDALTGYKAENVANPFEVLAEYYPAEALSDMQAHYAQRLVAA